MPPFPFESLSSLAEHQAHRAGRAAELRARRAFEAALAENRPEFTFPGYCICCRAIVPLKVDLQSSNGVIPNWRERLECPRGLNNRIRAALDYFQAEFPAGAPVRLYATEQVTRLFQELRRDYPQAVGSEFLRDGTARGSANAAGVRHEDLTRLSFPAAAFDAVLSFDVLEHVPDYRAGLRELGRVLRPGGLLLASFPFGMNQPETVVRATLAADGTLTHHLPPEYHGDPTDGGKCLCFQVFGWDILDEIRRAGFSSAEVVVYWSSDRGYLGADQMLVVARR